MTEYKPGFWIWNCDLEKLKRILLRDARSESKFTQWAIGEAIDNAVRAKAPLTRSQIEAEEAMLEDL